MLFSWSQLFYGSANETADQSVPAANLPIGPYSPRPILKSWCFLGGADLIEPHIGTPNPLVAMEPERVKPSFPSPGASSLKQPPVSMASPTTLNGSRSPSSPEDAVPKHDSAVDFPDAIQKTNRMSVSFPIQPSAPLGGPSALFDPTFAFPAPVTRTSASAQSSPTDNGFLTALAAQERRVLELKEELQRAEQDLDTLKRQWAAQESAKKRQDVRRIHPLHPLNTDVESATEDDVDGSSTWGHKEVERRKSLMTGPRTTHRRVFSGSKHTRALSLLSPHKMNQKPLPSTNDNKQSKSRADFVMPRPPSIARLNTAPDLLEQIRNTNTMDDITSPISDTPKEALRISRQMASDFKDGLWTFFEDLRQATVGDEAIVGPQQKSDKSSTRPNKPARPAEERKKPHERTRSRSHGARKSPDRPTRSSSGTDAASKTPTKSSPGRSRQALARKQSTELWVKEHLKQAPSDNSPHPTVTGLRKKSQGPEKDTQHVTSDAEEPWDMWDTPEKRSTPPKTGSSTSQLSSMSTSTAATSLTNASGADERISSVTPKGKRVATPNSGKRDAIPWPSLQKLAPGNLKRTASNLINEWEKSITPPPSAEKYQFREDYLSWPSPMNP